MTETLTGNRRYRQATEWGWIREEDAQQLLVLEVEVSAWTGTAWKCHWRDATFEDIAPNPTTQQQHGERVVARQKQNG